MSAFYHQYSTAIIGGALIGLAAGLVLLLHGRVAGVSGMVGSLFEERTEDSSWRASFLLGLVAGGFLLSRFDSASIPHVTWPLWAMMLAGFAVGLGARLGGGCTSGHGLCGSTLLNAKSIVATLVFMSSGALAVYLLRHVIGGAP
jgi:uncharacterized protein